MSLNIYDIAKLAGVSIATVSRVVNDSPKVSQKTKDKVLAVMAANDYTPNVFARGMSLNSMKTELNKRIRDYGYMYNSYINTES